MKQKTKNKTKILLYPLQIMVLALLLAIILGHVFMLNAMFF